MPQPQMKCGRSGGRSACCPRRVHCFPASSQAAGRPPPLYTQVSPAPPSAHPQRCHRRRWNEPQPEWARKKLSLHPYTPSPPNFVLAKPGRCRSPGRREVGHGALAERVP